MTAYGVGEVLHRSDRTLVTRMDSPRWGGRVVRTVRTGPEAGRWMSHEAAVLRLLAGVPGVPRLVSDPGDPEVVVADADGVPLASVIAGRTPGAATRAPSDHGGPAAPADPADPAPLPFADIIRICVAVTSVLADVHRRGVIHQDINPTNLLLCGPDRTPLLIDFELAVILSGDQVRGDPSGAIRGTLAYLAPEQTGRTGRPVDQRTDLYALGATLYELAAGEPPFGRGETDALTLISDHLARRPSALSLARPDVPAPFCDLVAILLEKEPEQRYQSAEGLLHDLLLIQSRFVPAVGTGVLTGAQGEEQGSGHVAPLRLGTRDYPPRFSAPLHPIGRSQEAADLAAVFAEALMGQARAVLVSGPTGVGKSALTEELRPVAVAAGGLFLTAACSPDGQGPDPAVQALGTLGRLLISEPEQQLHAHRDALRAALPDGGRLLAGVLPEFALLLGAGPDGGGGELVLVQAAVVQSAVAVLRAVTAASRPLVLVLDDLQWAPAFPLDLLDALLTGDPVPGLLVVGTFRDDEVTPDHPLSCLLARWGRLGSVPAQLRLDDLTVPALSELLAEVLRVDGATVQGLAELVHPQTGGNPYETIELLNGLRGAGALAPGRDGWTWDAGAVHRHALSAGRADVLAARIGGLPKQSRDVLQVFACLGTECDLELLVAATGVPAYDLTPLLAPCQAEGLLVTAATGDLRSGDVRGGDLLRLPHDRVLRALLDGLGEAATARLHLRIARRLAPDRARASVAAEQYLAAAGLVRDPDECRRTVGLLEAAARDLRATNPAAAERHLEHALALLAVAHAAAPDAGDGTHRLALQVANHEALFTLGRFEDADALYQELAAADPVTGPGGPGTGPGGPGTGPGGPGTATSVSGGQPAVPDLGRFAAGAVQVASLTARARAAEAVEVGLELLRQLDLPVPTDDDLQASAAQGLEEFSTWLDTTADAADHERPEVGDPVVRAAARIISELMPPSFFCRQDVLAWLVVLSRRLWAEHGPCRALVAPLCHAAIVAIGMREDFQVGYRVLRRVLDVAAARSYEPELSRARFLFTVSAGHWFEPLETVLDEARLAREGLLAGGDFQGAVFSYHVSAPAHLDTAATLDEYLATVESGLALAARAGNDQTVEAVLPFRRFVEVLRGESGPDGDPRRREERSGDPQCEARGPGANPMAEVNGQVTGALLAALLGDHEGLVRHARAAVPLLPYLSGNYQMSRLHLVNALALADQVRRTAGGPDVREGLLAELDVSRHWLAARAADSPVSFAHLLSLVDAERAWATGDLAGARAGFDRALQQVGRVHRPWQHAFLLERAAVFALSQGEEHLGGLLLGLARQRYLAWGATAKVEQLERAYPLLSSAAPGLPGHAGRSTQYGLSADTIDLMAVLKASQALSSETDLEDLRGRVVGILTAMTGATAVTVLLKNDDGAWGLPAAHGGPAQPGPVDLAGQVPLTVVRFAERTGEPVVVADVGRDQRFTTDPYLAQAASGSLLAVPILSRGEACVMLVLENRLHRGVFSPDRMDAVMLIAGQLAVSFDTAMARQQLQQEADSRLQLLDTLRAREQLLETLLAIQRDISHRAPLQTVLDAITAGASSVLGGEYVALVLAEPSSGTVARIPSQSGSPLGAEDEKRILDVATHAVEADSLISVPGGVTGPAPDGGTGGSALIAVPVHASGEIIGSLVAAATGDDAVVEERRATLAAFAEQVSLALNDATTLQAIHVASMDSLTGLATRPVFLERLERALDRRPGGVGVLFIDLDRFKQVNDSLGHDAGDQLLTGVADRIRGCIRAGDTAARLGGDEFAVLLEDVHAAQAPLRVGEALKMALLRPIRAAGKEIFASASIGVAVGVAGDVSAGELLKRADLAMYRAKRERSRRPVLFEDQMHQDVSARLDLEGDLERAVAKGQLWLQFQPQVLIDGPQTVGVEALVRWTHPERGLVSPAEFVPIAEDTGLIVDLGRWVLREACLRVAHWRRELSPHLRLSVNVSGRQLTDGRLAGDVGAILAESGLDAAALTLELTESVLMDNPDEAMARLEELKGLGVDLALDDFGTGYSSLSYLHRFPVDELKIDKSFIDKMHTTEADLAIVRVVVELARIMGLRTTAEGVETAEQRRLLEQLGCQTCQGYLIARPLDADDVPAFLTRARMRAIQTGRFSESSGYGRWSWDEPTTTCCDGLLRLE